MASLPLGGPQSHKQQQPPPERHHSSDPSHKQLPPHQRPDSMADDKEMTAAVIEGNDQVTGHIISTTIGGKNGEPKQTISYMAERVVGTGSFGVVFQAKCLETNETVAIKKVLQDRRSQNLGQLLSLGFFGGFTYLLCISPSRALNLFLSSIFCEIEGIFQMAAPPGPYSGVSQLALVARASAFAFGVVYGNMKLKVLKMKAKSQKKAEAKAHH